MGLYDRFELLDMRHNDGVLTYHAREIATARPVQIHFLSDPAENRGLEASLDRLPESERRRVLDRGIMQGIPYVVTDRLNGDSTFREWLSKSVVPVRRPGPDTDFWKLFDSGQASASAGAAPARAREVPIFEKEAESNEEPGSDSSSTIAVPAVKVTLGFVLGILAAVVALVFALGLFAFRSH